MVSVHPHVIQASRKWIGYSSRMNTKYILIQHGGTKRIRDTETVIIDYTCIKFRKIDP